jgi:hypothetical protein
MVSEIEAPVKMFFVIILIVYAILQHLTATGVHLTASEDSRQPARRISIAAATGMDLFSNTAPIVEDDRACAWPATQCDAAGRRQGI